MAFKSNSDLLNWIIKFAVLLLLIEVTFFDGGLLFSFFISAVLIYFGKKKWHKTIGKLSFMIGIISGVVTIGDMMTFRLILLALLGVLIYRFFQSKKHPAVYSPVFPEKDNVNAPEHIHRKQLLFKNALLGGQQTPDTVYEWEDINIQCGIGDCIVDISNTVLPKGEAVISIRNIVGAVKIYVPYEIEVKIEHSVIAGTVSIFENSEQRLFNESAQFYTAQYDQSQQKIKIITTSVVGNLEVKRI